MCVTRARGNSLNNSTGENYNGKQWDIQSSRWDRCTRLRVKILLRIWFEPLLNANQFIKVVILHHPTLNPASFSQYQPSKTLLSGAILYYTSLNYTAQSYFAKNAWKITLLGTTLLICDPDAARKTTPGMQEDRSPDTTLQSLNLESNTTPAKCKWRTSLSATVNSNCKTL